MRSSSIRSTGSAVDALSWAHLGERFDVALLDLQMPEMSGAEVASRLRSDLGEATPKLLLLSSVGNREKSIADGLFDAVLTNPDHYRVIFENDRVRVLE